jgi:hypothetical protein
LFILRDRRLEVEYKEAFAKLRLPAFKRSFGPERLEKSYCVQIYEQVRTFFQSAGHP